MDFRVRVSGPSHQKPAKIIIFPCKWCLNWPSTKIKISKKNPKIPRNPRSASCAIVVAVEVIVVAGESSRRQIGHSRVSSTLPRHPSPPPSSGEGRGGEEVWERRRGRRRCHHRKGGEGRGGQERSGRGLFGGGEREREESAWRERKEGRIKKERGDFEC